MDVPLNLPGHRPELLQRQWPGQCATPRPHLLRQLLCGMERRKDEDVRNQMLEDFYQLKDTGSHPTAPLIKPEITEGLRLRPSSRLPLPGLTPVTPDPSPYMPSESIESTREYKGLPAAAASVASSEA